MLSEADKRWKKSPKGVACRKRYDRSEAGKAKYKRYRNTEPYRNKSRERYYLTDENIRKAHYTVSNAVRDGRLIRSEYCEKCGIKDWGIKRSMIEAHHHLGYLPENWLRVQWLCTTCHKEVV